MVIKTNFNFNSFHNFVSTERNVYFVSKILKRHSERGVSNNAGNFPNLTTEQLESFRQASQELASVLERSEQDWADVWAAALAELEAERVARAADLTQIEDERYARVILHAQTRLAEHVQNQIPRVPPRELSLYDDAGRLIETIPLDPNSPLAQSLSQLGDQLGHWLNFMQ